MPANESPASGRARAIVDEPAAEDYGPGGDADGRGIVWGSPVRLAWIAAYAVAGLALFFCYLRVSNTQAVPSDGASNALEAWDMLHGNLLLHGWTLTDVSFYTTELPEYMAVELIRGLSPAVVHTSAAFTYTLLVLLAGLVAKGRATGREGVVRVLIGSGLMLAPQLSDADITLLAPDHVGTGVPLLVTFLVLDRAPRRWYTPPVIALMLALVTIGDKLAVMIAVVPLVLVCGIRVCRGLVQDRKPLAAQWFEVSLIAAGIASLGIAELVLRVIGRLGGFTLLPVTFHFASTSAMASNSWLTVEGVLGLYGANFFGLPLGSQAGIAFFHLAGVAMAAWAVCRALRRFIRCDDLLVQILTVGIVLNLAAYMFSTLPWITNWDSRQIAAVLPFGAVLAGRLLAGDLLKARLIPVMAIVLACYLIALGAAAVQRPVPAHDQALAEWLAAHNLTTGLSVYLEGNITTLDSGGRVQLRVPSWEPTGAVPRAYQSEASWYNSRLHYANFVVNTNLDGPGSVIPYSDVLAAFGPPATTYHYGPYTIMVWHKNLLADLGGPPVPQAGNI